MKRLLAMAMGLALLSTAALAHTPYTIAFSVKTVTNDDFQKAIATSIQNAVEKSGNKFLGHPGDETGVSTQVKWVEDLIAKRVDAIILNPMDGKAVVPVLKKAQAAKIPVIVVDSSVERATRACTSPTWAPTTSMRASWPASVWSRSWAARATF